LDLMFTVWQVSGLFTLLLSGLFLDRTILAIWMMIFTLYAILGYLQGYSWINGIRAKIRMGTWNPPTGPHCYVKIEIDTSKADEFITRKQQEGTRITYTGIALRSIGNAFTLPETRKYLGKIVWGRVVPLEDVDIYTLVDVKEGDDLGGLAIKKCDKMGISSLMEQMSGRVSLIKQAKDDNLKRQTFVINFTPTFIAQALTQFLSFIAYNLSLPIPPLRIKKNHFGSILLTNVSGLPGAYETSAPTPNFIRPMATIVLCTPKLVPSVDSSGKIVIAKKMNMMITFDHRYLDGKVASTMFDRITDVWNNPDKYE
jgi:pyruvate/2-oxoglutarate dehydrogenase complex dihydrolipoamide acyltransferase (E2) component